MNAPIVEDLVEVQCSCGRFHRLPSRIREFRCACHMTLGVNIDPYVSTDCIAPLPTPTIQVPHQPNGQRPDGRRTDRLPPLRSLPKLPAPFDPGRAGESDVGWKNDMLDVMERVAEAEDALHAKQAELERVQRELRAAQAKVQEQEAELAAKREQERQWADTLEQVKPILKDWEQLERENAKLCRAMQVARERGRVDLMDLMRRARSLRQMDMFR